MRMQRLWVSIAALCFGVLAFAEGSAWAAAEFSVDATSHDFGDSHVGTAKTFDFTISNVGTGNDLDITGFAPTGTECGDYVLSPASFTGGNKIAPGNSAVLTVTFTPGARGTRGCVFTSTDNDGNSTDTITLTGNGTSPTMTTTAGPLTFASTHVGTSAATQTITINNTSTDNDNLAFMVVVTSGNLHYTAIPASGSIPAGMSADITVTFTPAAKGSLPGNVRITGNDVANSQDDVVLAGTGTSPDMVVSPLAINFGNQRVSAGPTVAQLVTVQNAATGNEDLTFTYTELGPDDTDFSVAAPAMMTLAPGASTTLSIAFDPTASGARSDDLQIDGNDAFNASDTVALSGTGTEAIIAPNPAATLSIGNVTVTQNATGNIAVGNTGNTTLTVSSMTISGTNASEFSFASQGCAGQQCNNAFQVTAGGPATTVTIRCSPTSQGAKSALLTFTGDQDSGDNQVNLTCTGTRSVIAVNPLSLSFPDTKVGTTAQLTFTVANNATGTGAADLTYTIAKGGAGAAAFTVAPACTTTCTRTVGSAAQTHTVTFTPTARQDYAATLTITSNDLSNTPITITLTGKGIAPLITNPNPAGRTVAFGNVDVGTTSAASTISVQNTGDASLAITSATLTGANANQFRISSGTVGNQTVNVSGTATWQVVCEPTSIGAKTATFRITSDGFGTATYDFTLTCTGQRAEFVFAPAAGLNFGQVPVGNSSTLPVTITNNGNKTGTISSITSSNAVFTFAVVGGMPPRTVAAGASLTVNVTFTPANGNVLAEHLTVMTDGPPNSSPTSFQIPLAGDGTTMGIDVSVLTEATLNVDLGGLRVNTTAVRTVRVGNEGDTPFTLSAPSSSAGACTFGTFSPGLPAVIAGGGVATFNVNVTPTALGAGSCALTVSSSLPSTDTINIVWDGIAPEVALVNPASGPLDFAGVDVDAAPVTVAVQLRNSGTDTLNIASCAIVGSARFTVQSCPNLQVAEGATASIDVTFDPTVEAIETATLNLAVDAFSTNQVQVPLTGIGVDQNINLPSLLYEFPDTFRNPDDAPTLDIVVENPLNAVTNAGAPLTVSMAMSDETPVFEVQTPGPLTIDPDGQAGVTVSFSPTAAGITFEGTVTIVNDSTAQPMAQVTVRGRGVSRQVMQPMVCDLGTTGVNVPVKLSDLTDDSCAGGLPLTNIDPDGVTYRVRELAFVDDNGDPVTGAPFTLLDGADERMLAPAQTTLYDVEFAPTKSGQFEVYLAVYLDGDPVEHARITLRGHAVDVDVHGGGCQTGRGGVGWLGLVGLALGGALLRRRRGGHGAGAGAAAGLVVVAALATAASVAHADPTRNIELSTFAPAPSTEVESFTVETPRVGVDGAWAFDLAVMHATNLVVVGTDDPAFATMTDTPVSARTALQLGFAYAFAGRFEAGLRLPFYSQSGSDPQFSGLTPAQGTAFGDVVLHGKAALMSTASMGVAASLDVSAPTATDGQFAGVDGPSGHVHGIAGWHGNRLAFNGNLGLLLRGAGELGNISQGNAVTWGVGASYRALPAAWVIAESVGQVGMGSASPSGVRNLEGLLGVRYEVGSAIGVSVGVGRGVLNGVGSPDLRGFVLIDVSPRARKAEPLVTRPPPPPRDTRDDDGDGVVNADDACPMDAEDVDDFQDDDGCPDLDNDGDGIPDAQDQCPLEPEDLDGTKDDDGCIDPDDDGDGIPDVDDKCPNEPEDFDGYMDNDGCDEPDNDGDGIPDVIDQCALEPETINGNQDDDGCPDNGDSLVMVMPDRIEIFEPVTFVGTGATINRKSANVLGQVAATMRANRDFKRVRVTVHVHPRNSKDQELSDKRAEAVRDWLVQWGIEPERIEARGMGSTRPLVPKSQKGAAALNDRVEFIILEKEVK